MKKQFIKCSVLSLMLLVGFIACKKESQNNVINKKENVLNSENFAGVKYNGKWLSFETQDAFIETIESLKTINTEKGDEGLNEFENQFNDFYSIRSNINKLDENENVELDELISDGTILYTPDEVFGSIVSSDGFLQIEDSIYCFK